MTPGDPRAADRNSARNIHESGAWCVANRMDANTVTHILGVRAFGTVEHAEVYGVQLGFISLSGHCARAGAGHHLRLRVATKPPGL